jgi:DNA-binding beta-propeller fold protein YncE
LAGLAAVFALAATAAITGSPAASAGARPTSTARESGSPAVHAPTRATLNRSLKPADSGHQAKAGFGSALVGSAPVGNGPSFLAMDPATHTIYVANGYNDNGPNAGGDTVSVIDARRCNAQDVSRCKGPWPTITVGNRTLSDLPGGIAIDVKTDTVYVANVGANTVSVFNGATCNATITSGCGQTPAEVPVGLQPLTLTADPANHTVYVTNYGAPALGGSPGNSTTVSMIDSATCNATDLAACPATQPPTVNVRAAPDDVTVNQATHTVYVTTIGTHNGWAVFDADTCNATMQSGCATIGRLHGDLTGPNAAEIDTANDTLYSANYDNTISAFDLRHCNASDLTGCATQKPGTVTPFSEPPGVDHALYVAVDAPLHSVYVSYQKDDSLIVVDTNACNGSHLAGCATLRPPTIHPGTSPESVILDSQTQTLYTANEVDNDISVIDASHCNAQTTAGCRHPAPAMSIAGPGAGAADPAVHTAYLTSGASAVAMIDTANCNVSHLSGCAATPPTVTVGTGPDAVAVDRQTHTVYVASSGAGSSGTVSVINAATCNATSTAGCGDLATLQVPGGNPDGIAVNAATGTLYVATLTSSGPNLISVFNAATCNATHTTGCGQAPAVLSIGDSGGAQYGSALGLAVDHATNTIYATNVVTNTNPYGGDSVYVFNGATCNGANHTGCSQTPATINAGFNPFGIAVNQATDTIYTANIADGEHPGTVSVINGATCNGTHHTGCGQTPATAAAGFGAIAVAIDPATDTIYVANIEDTSVSVINGNTCNGTHHSGCGQTPANAAVGNYPLAIALDPAACTGYISNGDSTVSVIKLTHPRR